MWSDIKTEEMEEGAKNFVKEVKALPKRVRPSCRRSIGVEGVVGAGSVVRRHKGMPCLMLAHLLPPCVVWSMLFLEYAC